MDFQELVSMGFPAKFAKDACDKFKDLEAALNYLTSPEVAVEIEKFREKEQLETVDLSMSDSADVEMQRAIQQSVQQQTGAGASMTDEDEEMQKAIEESVQGGKVVVDEKSKSPGELLRTDMSIPVGLRNVGNTCYLNSMVQAFFTIPAVRDKILSLNWSQEGEAAEDPKDKLSFELQLLFGMLQLSERKFVDPLNLVNALFKDENLKLKLGQQEDPSEFGLFFSELLCTLKEVGPTLKPLIVGSIISTLKSAEEDGSLIEIKTTEDLLQIILEVEGVKSIYDSLDKYTSMEPIEGYETAKGFKTTAHKIGFINQSPPVLSFQLKRSLYNAKTGRDYKLHSRFFFPDQLHLNRYLEANKERTLFLRERAQQLAAEVATRNAKLQDFKKYSSSGEYRIDHCFEAVINYFQQNKGDLNEIVELLEMEKNNIQGQISTIEEEIRSISNESDHLFDEFSNDPYHLHAVLVHSGPTPRGGHYYSFIKSHLSNDDVRWFKFNDNEVTPVSFENVCDSSFGSEGSHSSAYCLIYIHNSLVEDRKPGDIERVNQNLRTHIEALNQKLKDDARDWELGQQKVFEMAPTIQEKFNAKFAEMMGKIDTTKIIDGSSDHFEVFLYNIQKENLGNYVLADHILRECIHQPIDSIRAGSDQFKTLNEILPQVPWALSADDRSSLNNIRQIYDKYINVLHFWITSVEKFIARDYPSAAYLIFVTLREFLSIEHHLPNHLKSSAKNYRDVIRRSVEEWWIATRTHPVTGDAVLEFANFLTSIRYDFGRISELEHLATNFSNQVRNFVRINSVDKVRDIISTIEGESIMPLRTVSPDLNPDLSINERVTKAFAIYDSRR